MWKSVVSSLSVLNRRVDLQPSTGRLLDGVAMPVPHRSMPVPHHGTRRASFPPRLPEPDPRHGGCRHADHASEEDRRRDCVEEHGLLATASFETPLSMA